MRSPVRRQPSEYSPEEVHARLSARIAALEDRVRRLEARLRAAPPSTPVASLSNARTPAPLAPEPGARARPRCPGCTLELPPGRRGESCVWCGFVFAAVARRRPARKKR